MANDITSPNGTRWVNCSKCGRLTTDNTPLCSVCTAGKPTEPPVSDYLLQVNKTLLDLVHNWEDVANKFRKRADKSKTADGKPNPEVCRAIAVGLEQCARDLRRAIGAPMPGDMIGR